jgi:hypothetical protein
MTVASSEAAGAETDVKIGRIRNGIVEVAVVADVTADGSNVKTSPSDAVVVVAAVMLGGTVNFPPD